MVTQKQNPNPLAVTVITPSKQRDKSALLLLVSIILLSGFFSFLNLSEFWTVGVFKQTGGYPFGGDGPTPWYYQSAELYATVNLVFGATFLFTIVIGVWSFLEIRKTPLWSHLV